ncbi:hypothetical protein L2E82_06816 [Cichorium intybus]|uniref:Uncharacterized protein n=1 Tax=Cichorium intybus TaxID=13427 RepID=A0ACB9HAK9_CICIN|nr:hypothetical protein L2E82_06816 [Cichorium intybus]
MQAQKEAPPDMHCKDKFLLQSVVASPGAAPKDITTEMFSKKAGNVVEECKLKVIYLPPPQPPSPVLEEPDEGAPSPKVSFTDSGNSNTNTNTSEVSRRYVDSDDNSSEVRSLVSQLTNEKNAAAQQSNKIRQEMVRRHLSQTLTRGGNNKSQGGGGVSFIVVLALALIGLVVGYLMKN